MEDRNETINELFERFKKDKDFIEDDATRERLAKQIFSMMIEV